MRLLIASVVLLSIYGAVECDYEKIATACMAEYNVTERQAKVLHSGTIKSTEVPQHQKCATMCFLEKIGVVNATTGVLLLNVVKEKFPTLEPTLSKCKLTVSSSPCDNGYRVMRCLWLQDEDLM